MSALEHCSDNLAVLPCEADCLEGQDGLARPKRKSGSLSELGLAGTCSTYRALLCFIFKSFNLALTLHLNPLYLIQFYTADVHCLCVTSRVSSFHHRCELYIMNLQSSEDLSHCLARCAPIYLVL